MYWFIGVCVKNSIDIIVEATTVHTIEFTCSESCHSSHRDVFFDGYVAGVMVNFGSCCSKDFSTGVSSFLKSLITHLCWILEEVQEVTQC